MKKIKYLIFTLFVSLISISFIKANEIYSIDVNVELNKDGSAHITEVWNMKVDKGTEVYKPMSNLGNSEISNFTVKDEDRVYTYLSSWNTSGTLSSKANKNGINYTDGGLELCWGMGSYGKHIYTISYDVSDVIYVVDDAEVLYWKFINDSMDPAPHEFTVTVSGPATYSDTLDVWGYGYEGYAYVYDGKIYMSNIEDRNFKSSEYAVLLVKYPIGTFNTTNHISKYHTFDDFYEAAEEGSYKYNNNSNEPSFISKFLSIISSLIPFFVMIFVSIFGAKKAIASKANYSKKDIDIKNVNNFRDIPCNKDIFKAFFLADIYNLSSKKEDLLGAVLLRWLKDGQIQIIKQTKKKLFGTKEITAIDLSKPLNTSNSFEIDLYQMMVDASKDNLLEENELKNWCNNNYSKFFKWFDKVIESVRNDYVLSGAITKTEEGNFFKKTVYIISDTLHEDAIKLAGLKKYLKEFSSIDEKMPIEVALWDEYLMFAQIFGIADEVSKQFKKLYPEIFENGTYDIDYVDIIWINNITSSGISSASAARKRAQSYSSGGGGFSSGGGGGGSFGGGSGGGCR